MSARLLCWFSCGAASAVAAKRAIERVPDAGRYHSEPDIECGVLCNTGGEDVRRD